jgi:hypothetical protein
MEKKGVKKTYRRITAEKSLNYRRTGYRSGTGLATGQAADQVS